MPATVFDIAAGYLAAGLSLIPIGLDGTKAPPWDALPRAPDPDRPDRFKASWKPFQERRPTDEEALRWWDRRPPLGLAIVCGAVSGGAECLDFDDRDTAREFLEELRREAPGLYARLSLEETPAGAHVWYRCSEIGGNRKLALPSRRECERAGKKFKALIETRGEGGYALCAGGPLEVHALKLPYRHVGGPPLTELSEITPGERDELFRLAMSFDREEGAEHKPAPGGELSPADDYDLRGEPFSALLPDATFGTPDKDEGQVRRPDKERGCSATVGYCRGGRGEPLLKVFTTSWPPFDGGKCYGRFQVLRLTRFKGDGAAAMRWLREQGYGSPATGNGKHPSPRGKSRDHPGPRHTAPSSNGDAPRAVLLNMADVCRRKIEWVWYPWLAAGEMALIDGDPGMAKSTLTLDWIARLSRGWEMPPSMDRKRVRDPARVVILSAEDDPAAVIRPRLDAAGADCSLIDFFPRVATGADPKTGKETWRLPTLPEDLELLAGQIAPDRRPKLVVVDPLMAFVGNGYDSNKDSDIRHCLHRAADSVRALGAALLVVRHLNKMNLAPALYRGGGSIGIIGAARVAMTVGHDPEDRQRWVLANNKNNLAPKPLALVYQVRSDPVNECGRIEWLGESDLTPDEILAHDPPRPAHRPADRLQAAITFLREQLADGNLSSEELEARAEKAGVKNRTLKAARKELKVEAHRIGDAWFCRLPPDPDPIPD